MMSISFIFLTCVFNNNDDDMKAHPPKKKLIATRKMLVQPGFFPQKPESAFLGQPWVNPHHHHPQILLF